MVLSTGGTMEQHQPSSAPTMKRKKSFFHWDPFSSCREGALDSENDDPCNDIIMSAAVDCSGGGCVEIAIDNVVSILRGLLPSSNGSFWCEEEDQAEGGAEVVTTHHHMEPTSTCNGSCSDDKITEGNSDPADNYGLLSPSSNGSSSSEEEDQVQADEAVEVTLQMEPTSTCNGSCVDDEITESNSDHVDDISLVATEPQSEHDIPDIDDEVEALNMDQTVATSLNVAATGSVKEDVDTALSWFVLTGILGSPAPSSVVKHHGRKNDIALFWDLEEGIIRGDHDDIPDIQEDSIIDTVDTFKDEDGADPLSDTCTTASESDYDSEADLCSVPDIDDMEQFMSNDEFSPQEALAPQKSAKKVADSALAWGALAMILNAPAPSAVATNNCTTKNVFEDNELTVELDDVLSSL